MLLDVLTEDPRWLGWSSDALAAVADLDLLTRDVGRCRTYFPTVRLVAPNS